MAIVRRWRAGVAAALCGLLVAGIGGTPDDERQPMHEECIRLCRVCGAWQEEVQDSWLGAFSATLVPEDWVMDSSAGRRLVSLGPRAVPSLMFAHAHGIPVHRLITALTEARLHTEPAVPQGFTCAEFRELGVITHRSAGELWWEHFRERTPAWFAERCERWEALRAAGAPEDEVAEAYQWIADVGVPALPLMVERVAAGDLAFVRVISTLTRGELPQDSSREDCTGWWDRRREFWTIPDVSLEGLIEPPPPKSDRAPLSQCVAALDAADWDTRAAGALALRRYPNVPEAAIMGLCELTEDESPHVAWAALAALGRQAAARPERVPLVLPYVQRALESEAADVQTMAVLALGRMAAVSDVSLDPVVARAGSPEPVVRWACTQALRLSGRPGDEGVSALARLVGDEHTGVSQGAIYSLGKLGRSDAAVAELEHVVWHGEMLPAAEAMRCLCAVPQFSQEALVRALDHPTQSTRGSALAGLAGIRRERGLVLATARQWLAGEDLHAARSAAFALKGVGDDPRALELLVLALGREDRYVREGALRALEALGPKASPAIPAIEGMLAGEQDDRFIIPLAERVLRKIRGDGEPAGEGQPK